MYKAANEEQRFVIDTVLKTVLCDEDKESNEKVFCLTAHAGCEKTFVQKAILSKLRSMQHDCISCAFSGIAASLLEGGRTLHNLFKLPIPLLENYVSGIPANSRHAIRLLQSSLIIIDEVSMCPVYAIQVIDRLLRDIASNGDKEKLFGEKTVLLCGDFQQTLPVVPHSGRAGIVESCVKSWPFWSQIRKMMLNQNMRALPSEREFIKFLKEIGNGTPDDLIEIPNFLISSASIIDEIYCNIPEIVQTPEITNRAILAPKNEDCEEINHQVLRMMPGEERTYISCDSVVTDNEHEQTLYPSEFLNNLSVSGLLPHKLTLKENAIVLLIRNYNTSKALINGTRIRVKRLHRNCLDCEVLTGASSGQRILIPRINLRSSGTLLPFILNRIQFR
nr:ATP-dependent DNA helicase PIF1 [Parasteatoda tepidariorum]